MIPELSNDFAISSAAEVTTPALPPTKFALAVSSNGKKQRDASDSYYRADDSSNRNSLAEYHEGNGNHEYWRCSGQGR